MATMLKGKLVAAKEYDSAEPVRLRFELTNHSKQDLYVLKWFTPLEGLNSDCLTVIRNAKTKVPYDGPMIKRGTPGPTDYVLVPAGQTVGADVNVSESYPVSVPANYQVELKIPGLEHVPAPTAAAPQTAAAAAVLSKAAPRKQKLTGGKTRFAVRKGPMQIPTRGEAARHVSAVVAKAIQPPAAGAVAPAAVPLPPTLVGGTAAQKAQVTKAHIDGFHLCETALAGLANNARFKEWFGKYAASRMKKVKTVYTKIRDRMKTSTFTYNLTGAGCRSGVFAYTHKGDTTIWLCGAFWTAAALGTDSKAGTMVHEHSHADADTDDVTYGQINARALAVSSPAEAVTNADNFEYFAGG